MFASRSTAKAASSIPTYGNSSSMLDAKQLPPNRWTRRRMLLGGAAIAAAATVFALRKPDHGGSHDAYFLSLSQALRAAGTSRPVLLIALARWRPDKPALCRI